MYDLVISNGRVIDPESGLDSIRNIGIRGGIIQSIQSEMLLGNKVIDAHGLIVSPGFIDLNAHKQDDENTRCQVLDGVTTALGLEIGTADVERWYADRAGKIRINYGVAAGHIPVRMAVMGEVGAIPPRGAGAHHIATPAELTQVRQKLSNGLAQGALGIGLGIQHTPAASQGEIEMILELGARTNALTYIHLRSQGKASLNALDEVVAGAARTGASLHIAHVQCAGLRVVRDLLTRIEQARQTGVDISCDCFPYAAGMTVLQSAMFDSGWQEALGIDYRDLQWVTTGERLTAEKFERYREQCNGGVIVHFTTEELVNVAVVHPLTMIATDGAVTKGSGHPRTSGSHARVLSHYVRETKQLTWMEAIRKMSLMPARRLQSSVPAMRRKGRICIGADADLVIFDPLRICDTATYDNPASPSQGVEFVLVNGTVAVAHEAVIENVFPGEPIRRAGKLS